MSFLMSESWFWRWRIVSSREIMCSFSAFPLFLASFSMSVIFSIKSFSLRSFVTVTPVWHAVDSFAVGQLGHAWPSPHVEEDDVQDSLC